MANVTREEIIKQCRYYKGEEECSQNLIYADTFFFWEAEQLYCLGHYQPLQENIFFRNTVPINDFGLPDELVMCLFDILTHIYIRSSDSYPNANYFREFMSKYLEQPRYR